MVSLVTCHREYEAPKQLVIDCLKLIEKNCLLFDFSDRTLYQIRSGPSVQEKSPGGKFARSPSKRAKSTKQRTVKRDLNQEPEPTKEESDVHYEEIEIDESQPNDEAYSTEVGAIGFS